MDKLQRKIKSYAKVLKKNLDAFIFDVIEGEKPLIIYHNKDTTTGSCGLPLILDYFRESLIVKKFNYKGILFCTIRFKEKWRQNVDFLKEIVDAVKQHRRKRVMQTQIGTEW
jgi:hypothetical protein